MQKIFSNSVPESRHILKYSINDSEPLIFPFRRSILSGGRPPLQVSLMVRRVGGSPRLSCYWEEICQERQI